VVLLLRPRELYYGIFIAFIMLGYCSPSSVIVYALLFRTLSSTNQVSSRFDPVVGDQRYVCFTFQLEILDFILLMPALHLQCHNYGL
jgi:hypothetical protein